MRAVREDEVAAQAVGVDTTRVKVLAFVISSMWAGVAGGLYAHYSHTVFPADYDFVRSVEIVTMVVLGGLGSITGATIAAVSLKVMDEMLRSVNGTLWVGIALIVLSMGLSFPAQRDGTRKAAAWFRWLLWPAIAGGVLLLMFSLGRGLIESPDTPGNAADWLRKVVYALMLIALMLSTAPGLVRAQRTQLGLAAPPPGASSRRPKRRNG